MTETTLIITLNGDLALANNIKKLVSSKYKKDIKKIETNQKLSPGGVEFDKAIKEMKLVISGKKKGRKL